MEEKNGDSFFQNKENYDTLKRKLSGINNQNQSTEIIPSEDIFINQKEEIKKIKKKKLELKAFRENFKEKQNLKCIQIKKDKNCSVYNTLNTLSSHKSDNKKNEKNFGKKIKKSKSFTNKKLREKRNKSLNNKIKH